MKNAFLIFILFISNILYAQSDLLNDVQNHLNNSDYLEVIKTLGSKKDISNVDLFNILGQAYYHNKNFKNAIDTFERILDLRKVPKSEDYYWLGVSNLEILQTDINFSKKGVYSNSAKQNLIKALELKPAYIEPRVKLVNFYINAPTIAGGSVSKAKVQANILKKYDKNLGGLLLASIHIKQDELDQAEAIYLELKKENTSNEKIYYLLAEVNYRKKNYSKVFEYCKKSIDTYPDYLMGYYQFFKTAAITSDFVDDGILYVEVYLKKDPDNKHTPRNHWVYYRLGQLQELKGNRLKAENAFKKSLEIKSNFKESRNALKKLLKNN